MSNSAIKAVFLSYASEDAVAARRICESLRSGGAEVWLDAEGGLEHGDEWDAKIRRQIKECALFIPLISANTQKRQEGYFRLEWELAAERAMSIASGVPFILPVVIDDTREPEALVPDRFRKHQWTRLSGGVVPTETQTRFLKLWSQRVGSVSPEARPAAVAPGRDAQWAAPTPSTSRGKRQAAIVGVTVAAAIAVAVWWRYRPPSPAAGAAASVVAASDKSVAVLAFDDLSEGHNSEFFSDGISEELLDVLAKVPGLKVTARTSSFYFKGQNLPIAEIAQKLNVAYVIEGSVQRVGENVRITAQLIKAADGYQVWSDHFDRQLKDVFALQDEIAGVVASNLSLKLGASSATATAAVNPEALEAYLQARQLLSLRDFEPRDIAQAEALLNRTLALEPNFARARAALADASYMRAIRDAYFSVGRFDERNASDVKRIATEARAALAIDPDSTEAHTALGGALVMSWNFADAEREYRRAIALNPNYALAHHRLSDVLAIEGRIDECLAEGAIASQLDPLSQLIVEEYGRYLDLSGRHREALPIFDRALALSDSTMALAHKGYALAQIGRRDEAVELARRLPSGGPATLKFRIYALAGLQTEAEALAPIVTVQRGAAYPLLVLNRPKDALAALDPRAVHVTDLHDWLFESWVDPIKDDPRFAKFLATLGITEYYARAQAWRASHPPEWPVK